MDLALARLLLEPNNELNTSVANKKEPVAVASASSRFLEP
jgi:hypothetical protein